MIVSTPMDSKDEQYCKVRTQTSRLSRERISREICWAVRAGSNGAGARRKPNETTHTESHSASKRFQNVGPAAVFPDADHCCHSSRMRESVQASSAYSDDVIDASGGCVAASSSAHVAPGNAPTSRRSPLASSKRTDESAATASPTLASPRAVAIASSTASCGAITTYEKSST